MNVFSLIILISCLCQPENIPALKYPVNIPEGVFSLPLTVAGVYSRFLWCCKCHFLCLEKTNQTCSVGKSNYTVDIVKLPITVIDKLRDQQYTIQILQ